MYFTVSNPKHFEFFSKTTQLDSGINSHRVSTLGWCFSLLLESSNHENIFWIHRLDFKRFFFHNRSNVYCYHWMGLNSIYMSFFHMWTAIGFLISCVKNCYISMIYSIDDLVAFWNLYARHFSRSYWTIYWANSIFSQNSFKMNYTIWKTKGEFSI